MKVCFVSHTAAAGGAERSLIELIDALSPLSVQCHVVVPEHGPLVEEIGSRGVPCTVLPYTWWATQAPSRREHARRIGMMPGAVRRLVRHIRRSRFDVVYSNTVAIGVGAVAARITSTPHVWHIHEFGSEDHGLRFDFGERVTGRLINRLSDACIVNSNAVAGKYRTIVQPHKLAVASYAVMGPIGEPPWTDRNGRLRCISVGTLQPGKRQEDAVRAVALLVKDGIDPVLELVGPATGEYGSYVRGVATDLGVADRVRFVGPVDDPFHRLRAADVALVCSSREAFGRVTIEAMRVGTPVIGTRSGGTAELIRDGFNGLLYHPHDPRDLAEKLRYASHNRAQMRAMGKRGKKWAAETFTSRRYGEQVKAVLDRVTSRSPDE
jgi:glycosyltransferase involved in cell wall biosynthesis